MESPAKKQRGSYICRHCGQPKRGHACTAKDPPLNQAAAALLPVNQETTSAAPETQGPNVMVPAPPSGFQVACPWMVLERLSPSNLLKAATVCRGWRDSVISMWEVVGELTLIDRQRPYFLLKMCHRLEKLFLQHIQRLFFRENVTDLTRMIKELAFIWLRRDFDVETLAIIAFTCQDLQVFQLSVSGAALNNITGNELSRFVANKQKLTCLKMEGCICVEEIFISSSPTLSTLHLSNLASVSDMSFDCCNLTEISLHFSHQEDDPTDLVKMVEDLGKTCPKLHTILIDSLRLSDSVVDTLTDAHFSEFRRLQLVSGIDITDASVAAISSGYKNLEQLGLSGSSITDAGFKDICQHWPHTLSELHVPHCRNITSNGIQYVIANLPFLELMDCGMTIQEENSGNQNLYISHELLKSLSLWGCSGLHVLHLTCPELNNLDLDYCSNLQPKKLKLSCPNLQSVYVRGCPDLLVQAIREQVKKECVLEQ